MGPNLDRRSVVLAAGAAAGLTALSPVALAARRPGQKLRFAAIGVGGMGRSDLTNVASHPGVEVVALCDVDGGHLARAAETFPDARTYADYRVLLAELGDELDAVTVSTPDHMHAAIALPAMARGLHVYCQKPLTRTVAEARAMARASAHSKVVTQMGIQNHSRLQLRTAKELFDAGHIGAVHRAYVWSDRPAGWWAQGVERKDGADPVPETLDWDLWLGVAPERPYLAGAYHPFQWRGREDFGTGAQGDMACHLMDPAVWFLGLGLPTRVRSEGPPPNGESFPLWSEVRYEFGPTDKTHPAGVELTWLDGGRKPPVDVLAELGTTREELPANGCLFLGADGALLADPYGEQRLYPAERFAKVEIPVLEHVDHWHQWVDACLGKGAPVAPFSYAAHLTEIALLGNIALRFPHETLAYDGAEMRFPGRPEADVHLRPEVREGWAIDGI
ncbi:MAG: Gfo/Idh/MocA family oxidoreductase [Planctomycetota bacterium]